jgi:hypothetical protein
MKNYTFVKSKFASRWTGIVLDIKERKGRNPVYLILIIKDKNGITPRKRILTVLDSYWTAEVNKFDLSFLNRDWLKNLPELSRI